MSCRLRLMLRPFARASRGIPAIDSETLYSARPELAHRSPAVTGAAHYSLAGILVVRAGKTGEACGGVVARIAIVSSTQYAP